MKRQRRTNRATIEEMELTNDFTRFPIAFQYLGSFGQYINIKTKSFSIWDKNSNLLCHFKSPEKADTPENGHTQGRHDILND